jgi:hypothetical protein
MSEQELLAIGKRCDEAINPPGMLNSHLGVHYRNDVPALLREIIRTQSALKVARDGLEQAQYDLERIETADWQIEQMQLGARSGAYRARTALKQLDSILEGGTK